MLILFLQAKADNDDSLVCIDAMAAFDFPGSDPNDLPLSIGQPVRVTAKVDDEWLYGQSGGKSGIFPALFVSVSEGEA